jgi:gas vesicle protein GvpL/GvpF
MSIHALGPAQTVAPTATASSRRYLFAVVYAAEAPPCACEGMDGQGISILTEGRLAAVVSGLSGPRIRPERRNLARHQEVLKQLLAITTPLPMSFGIVAQNPEEVQQILRRNKRMFLEQLGHVAGKVEMGLRVTWDVPNIFEYFINTHADLRAARDLVLGGDRPATQEEKIELGRTFDRLLSEDRENFTAQVERVLTPVCSAIQANQCRNERELMHLACLVNRANQEDFANAVFGAAQMFDNNFAFDYNGPWAPHNFVEISLAP